jgi:hypothetical protein
MYLYLFIEIAVPRAHTHFSSKQIHHSHSPDGLDTTRP